MVGRNIRQCFYRWQFLYAIIIRDLGIGDRNV